MPDKQKRTRWQFTQEFKRDAVELVRTSGRPIAEIARELGIYDSTLGNWVKQNRIDRGEQDGLSSDEHAWLRQLEGVPARREPSRAARRHIGMMSTNVMGRGWLAALLLGCLLLAQSCASAGGSGAAPGATSGSGRRSPGSGGSGPGATRGAGGPMGGLGDPVQARDGKVTVAVSSRSYGRGAPITAVVTNGLRRAIYTQDAKSDCSILLLQRLDGGSWADVGECALGRPPAVVAIGASHARTVVIHPDSVNFAAGASTARLPPGTYRLRLTYGFDPQEGQEPMAAVSPPFTLAS